jgi:hypothetical protein
MSCVHFVSNKIYIYSKLCTCACVVSEATGLMKLGIGDLH